HLVVLLQQARQGDPLSPPSVDKLPAAHPAPAPLDLLRRPVEQGETEELRFRAPLQPSAVSDQARHRDERGRHARLLAELTVRTVEGEGLKILVDILRLQTS